MTADATDLMPFDPATHKFGMAYTDDEGDIVYPLYRDWAHPDMPDAQIVFCPKDKDDGCVDNKDLTRAPEHDLVPRQAVTGDAMVYCVWRSDDESNHIFSTLEKAYEYAASVEASCVLSDYMVDSPQRHYERTN